MPPVIAICGTTGVGKSKLGIQLALWLAKHQQYGWKGARIINADSMQVYEGLDILTNKVPICERRGVDHLLMSFKRPGEQYVVSQWVKDAVAMIDETHSRNEIPIVVGGTAYWIQHLVFPSRLLPFASQPSSHEQPAWDSSNFPENIKKILLSLPQRLLCVFKSLPEHAPSASVDPAAAFSLHELLTALDPTLAARWHWKDTRKVLRGLRIINDTGQLPSEIFAVQSLAKSKPRYNTLFFWLHAKPDVLNMRLDQRVDEMIEQGVLQEIRQLRRMAVSGLACDDNDAGLDYTLGIFQSIGYREFDRYLSLPNPSEELYRESVERMKLSTRQYAKRQISWIRNKLLPAIYDIDSETSPVKIYLLDATEIGDRWDSGVQHVAEQLTKSFLSGDNLPDPHAIAEAAREMLTIDKKASDPASVLATRRKLICTTCTAHENQPVMIEEGQDWEAHQKTRAHRRLVRKGTATSNRGS